MERYKCESDERTRKYLKSKKYIFVELSEEQKDKLVKLENEIRLKEKDREQGKKTSEKMGIPENIATLDVVKIAIMMGLIKSKAIRDGLEPDSSSYLLDIFLGKKKTTQSIAVDFRNVPPSFYHAENRTTESGKIDAISPNIKIKSDKYIHDISLIIKKYHEFLGKKLMFHLDSMTVECFTAEGVSVMNDLIDGVFEEDDDRLDILHLVSIVRNYLFGFIPVPKYKALLISHVQMMENISLTDEDILQYISPMESHLIMFPKCCSIEPGSSDPFILAAQIHAFRNKLHLEPVDVHELDNDICTPALAFISVENIIQYSLLCPYYNNAIGCINNSFYLLKEIRDNIRLWVIDPHLNQTLHHLRTTLSAYLSSTFVTFYKEVFGDNVYRENFFHSPLHKISKIFKTLLNNLIFVNSRNMDSYIRLLVQKESPIIPTELDMFNSSPRTEIQTIHTPPRKIFKNLFK